MIEGAMDGKCLKPDSNFLPKKPCGARLDDRISVLPDEIILVILSLLSLREAAATSLLCRRWSDLWKHSPYLNFHTNTLNSNPQIPHSLWDAKSCKYIELVNSVLQSHKSLSLKQFRISFYVNKSGQSAVAKWLEIVLSRQVESLELDFACWPEKSELVVLEELLRESRISHDGMLFKSLKRLCLKWLKVSGEDIKLLLRNCPSLKRLILHLTTLTSDIDVCGGATLKLKFLDIRFCNGKKLIRVSAPNLTWIWVDEQSGKLLIENVPKLAMLGLRIKRAEYAVQHFASAVSCFISQLKILNLTLHHPKELLANGLFPQMPNLKNLVVEDGGRYEQGGLLPLTALIWASPRLRLFELKFYGNLKDATPHMEAIINIKRSRHRSLKVFKFQGCCEGVSDHIVELATYISNNCVALREIIIGRPLRSRPEVQADRDYLKQLLQVKLPARVHLNFFEPI